MARAAVASRLARLYDRRVSKKEKYVPFSATLPQMVMEALDRVKERKLINNRSALLLELLIPRLRDLDEQFDREMRLKTRGE